MEGGGRARSSSPPASIPAACPACNKPLDALRAGQVAIIDGAFRYFCDLTCKSAYVEVASKRPALEALTVDPPAVSVARSADARSAIASGVRAQTRDETARADKPAHASAVEAWPDPEDRTADESDAHADAGEHAEGEPEPHDEPFEDPDAAPSTLRSPLVDAEVSAEGSSPRRDDVREGGLLDDLTSKLAVSAPIGGVFAGVLAAVVPLAGEPAVLLRLPLALLAALVVVVRIALGAREASEPSPWVAGIPLAAASAFASVSAFVHAPHADAHATFVGMAAAATLAVELLLAWARRDVVQARARTASALAVTARVVVGESRAGAPPEDVVLVDASLVKPGEQVVVEAGETIAVDGIVAAGEAEVAPWLDSPMLVNKKEGEAVVAGAVVVGGRLRVNATFSGNERAWLRLAQATSSRIEVAAPLVAFMRRAVERGAPVAALVVAGAVYADNGSWLDVAVAACGAGFALAASAAVSAAALAHARGHSAAQRRGIVYKDAAAFDAAARADVAVVCSRGTILLGEPEIVAVEAVGKEAAQAHAERVLAIAAGAEMSSTHPFASAILHEARGRGVRPDNVRSALGHSGLGVTALAESGDRVIVGSRAFLLQEKVSVAIADTRTSELEAQGRSVLLVAVGGRLVGLLALQDGLRAGARAAIQRLHDTRIEPVLLSGEARETCETIARALDIEHVRPEVLPADRGAEVRALADGGRLVAALGHASTDDGALGAADVSVAMEAAGAAPGEWGVALASDDVRDAALALTVPRACRDRARSAIVVGALTQALGALGIAFGLAPPTIIPVLGLLAAVAVVSVVREPGP
jgi:cation transport ATPase